MKSLFSGPRRPRRAKAAKPVVITVPMADGPRLRFAVHRDGTVYELRRVGNRRVHQEPFRSELVARAYPEPAKAAP